MGKEESEYDVEAGEKLDKVDSNDSKSCVDSVKPAAKRRARYVSPDLHNRIPLRKHAMPTTIVMARSTDSSVGISRCPIKARSSVALLYLDPFVMQSVLRATRR